MLGKILLELKQIRKLLEELPTKVPESALEYLGSKEAKGPLQKYYAWNHRWVALLSERNSRTANSTYDYVDSSFGDALFHLDQFEALRENLSEIREKGDVVLDFGVYKGSSTRALARLFPEKEVHGFDSFQGLPERWSHALTGDFGDVNGELPSVPDNVTIHDGWFSDTVPLWHTKNAESRVALYRIDCDIYSSTADILEALEDRIAPGDILLFDELIGYRGWQHHEHRALTEFCSKKHFAVEYLAYGLTYVLLRLESRQAS